MIVSKITKGFLIGLCTLLLAGCGTEHNVDTNKQGSKPNTPTGENSKRSEDLGTNDANVLLDSAAMQGSVTDFTNSGCTVSQVISADGGQSAKIAAPGSENADTTVTVQYQENCIFQLAFINSTTGKAELRNAAISDIKKQTNLIIYGDFENTHTITAAKVIIARYE